MTIKEVAEYLDVHPATVYRLAQRGKIPAFKIGSDWRFHKRYIDEWIDRQMKQNGKKAGIRSSRDQDEG
jgi:excisionase family DNA binding protein